MPSTHVNSCPPEILREIFLAYVQTIKPQDVQTSRLNLCLVCKHWRQIALSHAQLWSTIYIYLQFHDPALSPQAPTINRLLKRSMNAPLEIYFVGACGLSPSERELIHTYTGWVFPLLASQASRWRRLVIDLDNTLIAELGSIEFAKAECLEYVDVTVEDDSWERGGGDWESDEMNIDERDIEVISALAGAPNLRSLKWSSGSDVAMRHILTTFPLERLTHFHLGCPMLLSEILHVMQKCTSVVEMAIITRDPIRVAGANDGPLPLVVLPNLRTLELACYHPAYGMLKYFDVPNLEIINILTNYHRWSSEVGDNDITPISNYLSSSRHRVQALLVHDHALRLTELATFLSNSAVFDIPVVQVCTSSLPDDIQSTVLQTVETQLPDMRRTKFKIIPDKGQQDSTIGWIDDSTYEKFKDYLFDSWMIKL